MERQGYVPVTFVNGAVESCLRPIRRKDVNNESPIRRSVVKNEIAQKVSPPRCSNPPVRIQKTLREFNRVVSPRNIGRDNPISFVPQIEDRQIGGDPMRSEERRVGK